MSVLSGSSSLILLVPKVPEDVSASPAVQSHCLLYLCSSFILTVTHSIFQLDFNSTFPGKINSSQFGPSIVENKLNQSVTAQFSHFQTVIWVTAEKKKQINTHTLQKQTKNLPKPNQNKPKQKSPCICILNTMED